MKNKTKIFIALALVLQLFIPSYLLIHHYSLINNALDEETEYCFKLRSIEFKTQNWEWTNTEKDADFLYFSIYDTLGMYDKRIAVSTDENGLAVLSELKNKRQTDSWFDYDYYNNGCGFDSGEFAFEPGIDTYDIITELRNQYSWFNRNDENREYAFVTAKVYKGLFIPTAIYFRGEKILTIQYFTE